MGHRGLRPVLIEKAIGASAAASAAFVAAAGACCKHWTKTKAAAIRQREEGRERSFIIHIADAGRCKLWGPNS